MRIPTDRAGVLNSIRRLPKFNPIERFPEQYPRLDAAREARGDAALIEEPGSHVTRWWREKDSNPRSPRKEPHANAYERRCSAPLGGVVHAIGTQIGFAIGGLAPVVAAAVQGGRGALKWAR